MLTDIERIIFVSLSLFALGAAYKVAQRIYRIIQRGQGALGTDHLGQRVRRGLGVFLTQRTVLKRRLLASLFHSLIAWGFTFYLLINVVDAAFAWFPDLRALLDNPIGYAFLLLGDVLTLGVLVGMIALLVRRFTQGRKIFGFNKNVVLHPKASFGIKRDSTIVGLFILFHVGARYLASSVSVALHGQDPWQPFANLASNLWLGVPPAALETWEHVFFWCAIGSIMLFIPYFLISKHLHLLLGPLNYALKPVRRSLGELDKINFEDESLTQFGVSKLEHLSKAQLLDAYACIMCNRCQDVCPAHHTGKVLSPSALEINKRYQINQEGGALAAGKESSTPLIEFAISPEAVWACTSCGACVEICPVANEPMRDILDIRRSLVLMDNQFPAQLQQAFKGMERTGNPWNIAPESRLEWAKGFNVPTIEQNPDPDILWWVGCAPATDARAQKTAQAFAKVLNAAGVNFAVLGKMERCTGDSARRAGNEALFFELATGNVEMLNEVVGADQVAAHKRIVTTCPHCLHTLKNEYPAFGGNYDVIHHTQLIEELYQAGKLKDYGAARVDLTFHDPCYLGRHNQVYNAPRTVLQRAGASLTELPRHHNNSFCCGAGGAQMWKEEEHGAQRVNENRFAEALATGKNTLAVGCPFCLTMLTDAAKAAESEMQVKDVAEVVAESIA
ncbi:putative iron-sulfur-binding oxidoreductase FadF [Thermoflexales bacterium]|nr:putative iron-sulfur-binding oxidoreductase FadF [Thermoflexales bacterium]